MNLLEVFQRKNSGEIARNRLKLLLVSERACCSPELLEMIKSDLIRSVSKYMEVDTAGLSIRVTQMDTGDPARRVPALFASIPIRDLQNKGSLL